MAHNPLTSFPVRGRMTVLSERSSSESGRRESRSGRATGSPSETRSTQEQKVTRGGLLFVHGSCVSRGLRAGPRLDFTKQLSKGDSANVSVLSLGSHTGTHVDAPSHFLDGAPGVDSLPPEALVGPAFVAGFGGESRITAAEQ